ncbi:MAG: IS3 family transposase [Crocinitomicaceae bacterium]
MSIEEKRLLISPDYSGLSIVQQCVLLSLSRSSYYYKPAFESMLNMRLMELIDRQFLEHPYYGVERMTTYLNKDLGYQVNEKRIRRLYRIMGLQTIYQKPNLSKPNLAEYKYPYLLKGLTIDRPNQVWEADITYIPMFRGFMYLFAIIDVYSRKIVGWGISNTMTTEWCKSIVEKAIKDYGRPEIFNTDQGSQFTNAVFTEMLNKHDIRISMDGKGRALDNIYIERFWRSIKYEKIYLNPSNGGIELWKSVNDYINFYNGQRRQEVLNKMTPNLMYESLANVS